MATTARSQPPAVAPGGTIRSRRLPPDPASVSEARHFAVDAVSAIGAPGTAVETELLVSELATNAVVHARTPMRVSVRRRGRCVRVEVSDDDPRPPTPRGPDPMAANGRGMMLVEALARRWGVTQHKGGKTIWFEL